MYHGGKRIYVGKAGNLQNRIWKAHCGQSKGLSNSAFRRNVAEQRLSAPPLPLRSRRVSIG